MKRYDGVGPPFRFTPNEMPSWPSWLDVCVRCGVLVCILVCCDVCSRAARTWHGWVFLVGVRAQVQLMTSSLHHPTRR